MFLSANRETLHDHLRHGPPVACPSPSSGRRGASARTAGPRRRLRSQSITPNRCRRRPDCRSTHKFPARRTYYYVVRRTAVRAGPDGVYPSHDRKGVVRRERGVRSAVCSALRGQGIRRDLARSGAANYDLAFPRCGRGSAIEALSTHLQPSPQRLSHRTRIGFCETVLGTPKLDESEVCGGGGSCGDPGDGDGDRSALVGGRRVSSGRPR